MRAFIALKLGEGYKDDLAALARTLSARVDGRFMARATYHVTLAFLGEVDEAGARRAMDALDAACAGAEPVELRCQGLGRFKRGRDDTLFLDVAPAPELEDLAARVRAELGARGLAYDGKPFRAHITLARRARLRGVDLADLPFPPAERADTAALFKSTLTPEGAVYKELYAVRLGVAVQDGSGGPGRFSPMDEAWG